MEANHTEHVAVTANRLLQERGITDTAATVEAHLDSSQPPERDEVIVTFHYGAGKRYPISCGGNMTRKRAAEDLAHVCVKKFAEAREKWRADSQARDFVAAKLRETVFENSAGAAVCNMQVAVNERGELEFVLGGRRVVVVVEDRGHIPGLGLGVVH